MPGGVLKGAEGLYCGCMDSLGIDPLRYSVMLLKSAAIWILLLQIIQFISLNLDAFLKIGRAVLPMLDMFVGKW